MVFHRCLLMLVCCLQFAYLLANNVTSQKTSQKKVGTPVLDSDFKLILEHSLYVDKTLFIEKFISEGSPVIITRPRRFGKSTMVSMLKYFFTIPIDGSNLERTISIESSPNYKLFESLKIFQKKEIVQKYLGKRPVIHLDFGTIGLDINSEFEACTYMKSVICAAYYAHHYLLKSNKLESFEKAHINNWLQPESNITLSNAYLFEGARSLTTYLRKHYGEKCVVLIDEFDAFGLAALNGDNSVTMFENIVNIMVGLLSNVLKTNTENVEHSAVFGISHTFALGSTKMNLVNIYKFLSDERYVDFFGILEFEFQDLIRRSNKMVPPEVILEAKDYYNGYVYNGKTLYCTYSVMKFIDHLPSHPEPYWYRTESLINFRFILTVPELHDMVKTLLFDPIGLPIVETQISTSDVIRIYNHLSRTHFNSTLPPAFVVQFYTTVFLEQGYLKIEEFNSITNVKQTLNRNSGIIVGRRGKPPNKEIRSKLSDELKKFYVNTGRFDAKIRNDIALILITLDFNDELHLNSALEELHEKLNEGVKIYCEPEKEHKLMNEEVFRFYVLHIIEHARADYTITPEVKDVDILLERKSVKQTIIIELKYNDNIHNGFFQILHREYYKPYETYPFIIIALNFKMRQNVCVMDMMYQINKASVKHDVSLLFHDINGKLSKSNVKLKPTPGYINGLPDSNAKKELLGSMPRKPNKGV